MEVQELFAVVCVSNMERSVAWFTRLIGRGPDTRPMAGLVEWHDLGRTGLQLVSDVERAGSSLMTVVTPDMNRARRALAKVNLTLGPDLQGDYAIIAQIRDPDGNEITLTEPGVAAAASDDTDTHGLAAR